MSEKNHKHAGASGNIDAAMHNFSWVYEKFAKLERHIRVCVSEICSGEHNENGFSWIGANMLANATEATFTHPPPTYSLGLLIIMLTVLIWEA